MWLVPALSCPVFLSTELSSPDSGNIWPFAPENSVACLLPRVCVCIYISLHLFFLKNFTFAFLRLHLALFSGWELQKTFLIRWWDFFSLFQLPLFWIMFFSRWHGFSKIPTSSSSVVLPAPNKPLCQYQLMNISLLARSNLKQWYCTGCFPCHSCLPPSLSRATRF